MTTYDVAVVGTGRDPEVRVSGTTHSWGFRHGAAYAERDDCELVACVDREASHAAAFAERFDVPHRYTDLSELLAEHELDLVSVCTPTTAHHGPVVTIAREGGGAAVHCEKPMARTWREAREMASECDRRDVRLTVSHQRRFAEPFRRAKALLDAGEIGELERIEVSWGNFFDNGSHTVDLCGMFVDESPPEWIIGQVDYREEHVRYGVHHANQAFMLWQYANGVHAVAATGDTVELTGSELQPYDCFHRLHGTDGELVVGPREGPPLRVRRDGEGWERVAVEAEFEAVVDRAVADVVETLDGGETELDARNALKTAELLFAGHESARRRGRVELPLDVDDHPLESMVEAGELTPAPAEKPHRRPPADREPEER